MKTEQEIKDAIQALKENKTKTRQRSNFGDDNHKALDIMIETLEQEFTEDDVYRKYRNNDAGYDAAISMVYWKDSNDPIEDHLYPENL